MFRRRRKSKTPFNKVLVLAITLLAFVVAACSATGAPDEDGEGEGPDGTVSATTSAEGESGGEEEGGVLRVVSAVDLRLIDNLATRDTTDKLMLGSTVYDSLFQSDANGEPAPALATSASSEDNVVWTIELRDDVDFHNGKHFTAEDVKANIEAILDPENASPNAGDLESVESVEVVDTYTVELTLAEPNAQMPAMFTDYIFMGDMEAREEAGDAWVEGPIGTGPYKWSEYVPGDHASFTRNEDYWRGRPPLDGVEFVFIPDPQVAAIALQQGEVHVIPSLESVSAVPSLEGAPNVELFSIPTNTILNALPNFEKARRGGYEDADAFRRGIAHLINSEEIVPNVIGDSGVYLNQFIPPWQRGHVEDFEYLPYDEEEGMALLAQGGVEPGDEINLLVWQKPYNCEWATDFQSRLTELGYNATLQCLASGTEVPETEKYEWDVLFTRHSGRASAAQFYWDRWHRTGPVEEYWTFRDDEVFAMIEELQGAQGDRYDELAEEILNSLAFDHVAYYPGWVNNSWWVFSDRVNGLSAETISPLVWSNFTMNGRTTVTLDGE